jgi:hypothetical protein
MNPFLHVYDMQVIHIGPTELHAHCPFLSGTQNAFVDLSKPAEQLVVGAAEGLRVGDSIPCVPLARDRERDAWLGSVALGQTIRFLANKERNRGSSQGTLHGQLTGRALVRIDSTAIGILSPSVSDFIRRACPSDLGPFAIGCPGDDPASGLLQAVLPVPPPDARLQLGRVLCVLEYAHDRYTKRRVRIIIKSAAGVIGVASASKFTNWSLPVGTHVTAEFSTTPLINPPTETNCAIVGADFQPVVLPVVGSTVDAIVTDVHPYGAFCLVSNGVTALMHRRDCQLNHTDDVTQRFSPGDRVKGIVHPSDRAKGTFRFQLVRILERRKLRSWNEFAGC